MLITTIQQVLLSCISVYVNVIEIAGDTCQHGVFLALQYILTYRTYSAKSCMNMTEHAHCHYHVEKCQKK